uniref:Uncharacterized protein n=1 Tax=Arundo donax TaxID=35708 RepID=A0A0A9AXT6_ARUDO
MNTQINLVPWVHYHFIAS